MDLLPRPVLDGDFCLIRLPALYVSADLEVIHVSPGELRMLSCDLTQGDPDRQRAYRRLDLRWYQWLFRRMSIAQELHQSGRLASATWETMRDRFTLIWRWMRDRYLRRAITAMEAAYPDARYLPPLARDTRALLALFSQPGMASVCYLSWEARALIAKRYGPEAVCVGVINA